MLDNSPVAEGPGIVIGRYRLIEKIGEGGMAVVYMAEQAEPIRRKLALKIIKLGMDTKQVIARFEAERQALAMMDHSNIARVFDAGATNTGRPYFVMELVTGVSITEYCDQNNLNTRDRLKLFIQVCSAIQHAHQKGIIHRDIKPTNVMVTCHDGQPLPKVIDFGIAKATKQRLTEKTLFTRHAHIIGTPAYMSPEQAQLSDVDIDTRSDIYSLGILLYELLTGTTPFGEEDLRKAGYVEMQRVILQEEPTKPSTKLSTLGPTLTEVAQRRKATPDELSKLIRGDLDWIVMKALEKDRTRRYDSTTQLLSDIRHHLENEPVSAGPPSACYITKKFLLRHGELVATLIGVLALILAGAVFSTVLYLRAERAIGKMTVAQAQANDVVEFLTSDLLAAVYPERAKGPEVTVSYLLDNASTHLEQKFADNPLAEAKIRDAIGSAYEKMGKYDEAELHFRRALALRRAELGDRHAETLASLDHLGWLCWCQGRLDEGASLTTKALDGRQQVLGPKDPNTIASMVNLSWLTKDYREALTLAERAYQTASTTLEADHPVRLDAAVCLAFRCVERSRLKQAEELAPMAYRLSRRTLGPEHRITLTAMNVLVWLHDRRARFEAGIALGEESLEIAQHVLGEKHVLTLYAMSNLGSLYLQQNRLEEAEALLTHGRAFTEQHLGTDHMITVCCGLNLSYLYRKQGRFDETDALLASLLETARRSYGEGAVLTGFVKYGLILRMKELETLAEERAAQGQNDEVAAARARREELRTMLGRSVEENTGSDSP